jgi:hypothetical protein
LADFRWQSSERGEMGAHMKSSRWGLAGIMLAVLAWGTWLAIGAVRYNGDLWRGVIVLGSVAIFLGGWLLLLAARHRSLGSSKRR